MNATCGLPSVGSSSSAALQSLLENRLRAKTAANGSILYRLTWKHWDLPSGRRICALRGSNKRTSVNVFTLQGWPTPLRADGRGRAGAALHKNSELPNAVQLAGWPTPDAQCMNVNSTVEIQQARRDRLKEKHNNSNGAGLPIGIAAQLAGWSTPVALPDNKTPEAHLAMKTRMGERDGTNSKRTAVTDIQVQAKLSGWATPQAGTPAQNNNNNNNNNNEAGNSDYSRKVTAEVKTLHYAIRGKLRSDGTMLIGSCAEILPENQVGGPLSPGHSRWLMGLPTAWASCAPTETLSILKRRKISANLSKKSALEYDL